MRCLSLEKIIRAALALAGASLLLPACSPSECVSDEEYKQALAQGRAVDLLRCAGNAPLKVQAACTPNSLEVSLSDDCGIFVSNSIGNDNNAGTMQNPVKSIAEAITLARAGGGIRVIYLCGEHFDVPLLWPDSEGGANEGAVFFGGLKCDDLSWIYQPNTKTLLTAPEGNIPLRINGHLGPVNLYDVQVESKHAPATNFGASSVALMVNEASVLLYRSLIIAGDGAPGITGASMNMAPALGGISGSDGAGMCSKFGTNPTTAPTLDCGGGVITSGGLGGSGGVNQGWDGTAGTPGALNNAGLGEPDAGGTCTNGGDGEVGISGAPGEAAVGMGSLDWDLGYIGISGGNGQPGTPGQGGGGGGGRDDANMCSGKTGPAGGSGGTGGCGGLGGSGGGPGGSSFAIVSFRSNLMLSATQVQSGNGGVPGFGGAGQEGGMGGLGGQGGKGGSSSTWACAGGIGGKGGNGGSGGNGVGGHSIGVAYLETAPILEDGSGILVVGTPGEGGLGVETQAF